MKRLMTSHILPAMVHPWTNHGRLQSRHHKSGDRRCTTKSSVSGELVLALSDALSRYVPLEEFDATTTTPDIVSETGFVFARPDL